MKLTVVRVDQCARPHAEPSWHIGLELDEPVNPAMLAGWSRHLSGVAKIEQIGARNIVVVVPCSVDPDLFGVARPERELANAVARLLEKKVSC